MRRPDLAVLAALLLLGAGPASGDPPPDATARAVAEAARLADLPPRWIEAVIAAESGGDPRAVSPAGARGLMQLMPGTWRMLRARLGLGDDPYDVRDNVVAGAAYLRELHDRFGAPGFLAAYNAGPARYAAHVEGRRSLPAETRDYVARVQRVVGAEEGPIGPATAAPLFPEEDSGQLFAPECETPVARSGACAANE
ncbi:lytic transglycosylase domain-containing protein [Phenylobacterium sp.]|uniref:lytic transglycosylase domain-containing protein n=1 Tax=Phenylobacterium sp. TaxID=1871053 RepID=UPI002C917A0B|nr:lytic transglycosylase domain-containing protein [Phenylobacterium sp.]HVI32813.1 lytic transglycosylase domain-containing protein [Phenylobacterium sp.]